MVDSGAYDSIFDVTQTAQSARLKQMAVSKDPQALKVAAKQFESFFLDSMMKSMRSASKPLGSAEWLHSSSTEFFEEMYDQQLSLNLVKGDDFGIAQMVEDQLSGKHTIARNVSAIHSFVGNIQQKLQQAQSELAEQSTDAPQELQALSTSSIDKAFDDPVKFVKTLWADAVKAAEQLNLDPKLLIAQAALETGWGKSIISGEQGSSFNLFNIKADSSWLGDKVAKDTIEYEEGIAVKKKEPFRSYRSFAESFKDYTTLLNTNARYGDALSMSHDPMQYLNSLQEAGYATDPNYANKVYQIYRGDTLTNAISTMFTR